MKVFISWSGGLSRAVAVQLKSWLEDVLQGVEGWISTEDIDKGSIWFTDISNQLAETSIGIICLTQENVSAPWILFEAGALSKGLSKSRVCPLLIDLTPNDLKPPLSQFNGVLPQREDMLKLVKTINGLTGKSRLPEERVERTFDRWWDQFESRLQSVLDSHPPTREIRPPLLEDMVSEVLQIVRSLQSASQSLPVKTLAELLEDNPRKTMAEVAAEAYLKSMRTAFVEAGKRVSAPVLPESE